MKRLSTLHAVTISTPIKFKIVSVKNDNEKSVQGTEINYSKIVYTIEIVNKQKTNTVEKDLQEIADFFSRMCTNFPGQLKQELL